MAEVLVTANSYDKCGFEKIVLHKGPTWMSIFSHASENLCFDWNRGAVRIRGRFHRRECSTARLRHQVSCHFVDWDKRTSDFTLSMMLRCHGVTVAHMKLHSLRIIWRGWRLTAPRKYDSYRKIDIARDPSIRFGSRQVNSVQVFMTEPLVTVRSHEKHVLDQKIADAKVQHGGRMFHTGQKIYILLEIAQSRESDLDSVVENVWFREGYAKSHAISSLETRKLAILRFWWCSNIMVSRLLTCNRFLYESPKAVIWLTIVRASSTRKKNI